MDQYDGVLRADPFHRAVGTCTARASGKLSFHLVTLARLILKVVRHCQNPAPFWSVQSGGQSDRAVAFGICPWSDFEICVFSIRHFCHSASRHRACRQIDQRRHLSDDVVARSTVTPSLRDPRCWSGVPAQGAEGPGSTCLPQRTVKEVTTH